MGNIWIDISNYNKLSWYGIVTTNIIDNIIDNKEFNFFLFTNRKISLNKSIRDRKNIKIIITKWVPYMFYRFFYQAFLCKKYKIDLFYSLDQFLPLIKVCRYICTIHDVVLRRIHHWIKNLFYSIKIFWFFSKRTYFYTFNIDKLATLQADWIVCPSEYTKMDVINNYIHNKNTKLYVIHRWIDHIQHKATFHKRDNYIFLPFCSSTYDDFVNLLTRKILEETNVEKIIFFKPQWELFTIKESNKISILTKTISESEKEKLFTNAILCIYISEWDWFWFIPLESMAYGTPVIFNSDPCAMEISWEWGIGIPKEVDSFIVYIKKLLADKTYNQEIGRRWTNHIEQFTWGKTVNQIISMFKEQLIR